MRIHNSDKNKLVKLLFSFFYLLYFFNQSKIVKYDKYYGTAKITYHNYITYFFIIYN